MSLAEGGIGAMPAFRIHQRENMADSKSAKHHCDDIKSKWQPQALFQLRGT